MERDLVARWNAKVAKDDLVINLGDFCLGTLQRIQGYLEVLNGRQILIKGNHDRHSTSAYLQVGFEAVYKRAKIGSIYLIHKPPLHPDIFAADGIDLVIMGHVHEKWVNRGMCYNVGVDVRNYAPVTLEDLGHTDALLGDGRVVEVSPGQPSS